MDYFVYGHIADRQWNKDGQCWQSNTAIGKDLGYCASSVSRSINRLKRAGYLSVWWSETGRRMRVMPMGLGAHAQGGRSPLLTDKENNIKKTTQTVCVSSLPNFSKEHRALFGEGHISKLVATFGVPRVERGLLAWEATDKETIRNPIAWLTRAVKDDYEPRTAHRVGRAFPQSSFDHDEIIKKYIQKNGKDKCLELSARGLPRNRIAYKIWIGKI